MDFTTQRILFNAAGAGGDAGPSYYLRIDPFSNTPMNRSYIAFDQRDNTYSGNRDPNGIYFSNINYLFCVEPEDGSLRWQKRIEYDYAYGSQSTPTTLAGSPYGLIAIGNQAFRDINLNVLDRVTGNLSYSRRFKNGIAYPDDLRTGVWGLASSNNIVGCWLNMQRSESAQTSVIDSPSFSVFNLFGLNQRISNAGQGGSSGSWYVFPNLSDYMAGFNGNRFFALDVDWSVQQGFVAACCATNYLGLCWMDVNGNNTLAKYTYRSDQISSFDACTDSDGNVFVYGYGYIGGSTYFFYVYKVSPTGSTIWSKHYQSSFSLQIARGGCDMNNDLYLTADGNFVKIDGSNGYLVYLYNITDSDVSNLNLTNVIGTKDHIYIGTQCGYLKMQSEEPITGTFGTIQITENLTPWFVSDNPIVWSDYSANTLKALYGQIPDGYGCNNTNYLTSSPPNSTVAVSPTRSSNLTLLE
jgi:hypothetical protein